MILNPKVITKKFFFRFTEKKTLNNTRVVDSNTSSQVILITRQMELFRNEEIQLTHEIKSFSFHLNRTLIIFATNIKSTIKSTPINCDIQQTLCYFYSTALLSFKMERKQLYAHAPPVLIRTN